MKKQTKKSATIGEYIIESGEQWQAKAYKIPRSVWAALKECARKQGFEFTPEKETTHSLGWKLLKEFCDGADSGVIGEYHIERKENGHINLYVEYKNTIGALREVARHLDGLEWDEKWNTRSAGRRIVDYALEHPEFILKKAKEIIAVGEYIIEIKDRKVRVYKEPRSAFAALRECATKHKFEFIPEKETTHSLGWKLLKEFCGGANSGTIGEYHIERKENGHIDISVEYKNAIKALREMAKLLDGFEWDEAWTTFDVARKVVEYALEHPERIKKVKREKKAPIAKHAVGSSSSDIDYEALTEVDDDELENDFWQDEYGVKYSKDKKRLLKAEEDLEGSYSILPGTEVICDYAFSYQNIENITIPDTVTAIGKKAFFYCFSLERVKFPDSVIYFGESVFESCEELKSVTLPKSIDSIPSGMFEDCCNLENISVPESLTSIGENAFRNCPGNPFAWTDERGVQYSEDKKKLLEAVEDLEGEYLILPGTEVICERAFQSQRDLQSVIIPDTVTRIEDLAFNNCELKAIEIPESVKYIGKYAFSNCESLESINILGEPEIGEEAFKGCPGYDNEDEDEDEWDDEEDYDNDDDEEEEEETHDIEYYMEMAQVSEDDFKNAWTDGSGVMYSADKKRLLKAPNELTGDYTVLPGTEVICDDAFVMAYGEVIMPYGLRYIGKRAFRDSEFYDIRIPESVILVGNQAFQYCVNADSLAIGKNTEVGRFAFMGTDFSFGVDVVDSVIELTLKPLKGKLSNDSIGEILANIGEEDKPCGKTKLMFSIDLDENTTRYVWSRVGDWSEELLSEFVRKVNDFCQKTLGKSVDEVVDYEAYYVSSIKELAGDYWTVEEMLDGVAYAIRKLDEGDDYDPSMNDENEAYYNGFNSSTEDKFHLGNVLFSITWGDGGESNLFLDVRNDVTNFDGTGNYGIAAPYQDICDSLRMMSLLIPGYSEDEDEGDADEDADTDDKDEE